MEPFKSRVITFERTIAARLGLLAALAICFAAAESRAAVLLQPVNSGVQSRFASQSQIYMNSDPLGLNPWPSSGAAVYPSGAPIPALPPAPAPSVLPAPGNAFSGGG